MGIWRSTLDPTAPTFGGRADMHVMGSISKNEIAIGAYFKKVGGVSVYCFGKGHAPIL
jgi:hypothetical protein